MKLRPLLETDLVGCASLFVDVFNRPPWNEQWQADSVLQRLRDFYLTPGFVGLVAADADDVVGFVLGNMEQWDRERHFNLKEMCVATQRQRAGVGSALIRHLEAELAALGVARIYLLTARASQAQSFYQQCGFYVSQKMIMMGKRLQD